MHSRRSDGVQVALRRPDMRLRIRISGHIVGSRRQDALREAVSDAVLFVWEQPRVGVQGLHCGGWILRSLRAGVPLMGEPVFR